MLKDKKYMNAETKEIIKASQYAKEFLLSSYTIDEDGNKTALPEDFTRDQLIEYGMSLIEEDEDYISI